MLSDAPISPSEITQGTLLDKVTWPQEPENPPLGIVLSNPCDLEHGKASYMLVSPLLDASVVVRQTKEWHSIVGLNDGPLSKSKQDKLRKLLGKYIHNIEANRRHFCIRATELQIGVDLLMVDFQNLHSLPIESRETVEPLAQLESPYREQMMMHFVSYVARIGVDRVDGGELTRIKHSLAGEYLSPAP